MEAQSVGVSVLLRMEVKIPIGGDTEIKCGGETEEKGVERLLQLWIHPIYSCHCECQQVLSDRSLILLSPERLCQCLTDTEVDAHSHPLD